MASMSRFEMVDGTLHSLGFNEYFGRSAVCVCPTRPYMDHSFVFMFDCGYPLMTFTHIIPRDTERQEWTNTHDGTFEYENYWQDAPPEDLKYAPLHKDINTRLDEMKESEFTALAIGYMEQIARMDKAFNYNWRNNALV